MCVYFLISRTAQRIVFDTILETHNLMLNICSSFQDQELRDSFPTIQF